MKWGKGASDRREELFGGTGAVTVWNLLGRRRAEPFTAALACELEPGGSVGRHLQEHFPEIVVGLEGEGQAWVDGVAQPLGPGDIAHLPKGSVLALENTSTEAPLRYLIIKARDVAPASEGG